MRVGKLLYMCLWCTAILTMGCTAANEAFDLPSAVNKDTRKPIGVKVYTPNLSRAVTPFTSAMLQSQGFSMFCIKQDTESGADVVDFADRLSYGTGWEFSQVHFWPSEGNTLDFYSTNLVSADGTAFTGGTAINLPDSNLTNVNPYTTDEESFPYVAVLDMDGQFDFMTATTTGQSSSSNQGTVEVEFGHLLSHVKVNIEAPDSAFIYNVYRASISNVFNGFYDLKNASWIFDWSNNSDLTALQESKYGYKTTASSLVDTPRIEKYIYQPASSEVYGNCQLASSYDFANNDLYLIPSGDVELNVEYLICEKDSDGNAQVIQNPDNTSQYVVPNGFDFTGANMKSLVLNSTTGETSILGANGLQAGYSYTINITLGAGPGQLGVSVSAVPAFQSETIDSTLQ